MRYFILICAVVALVGGCGGKKTEPKQQAEANATTVPKTQPKEEVSNTQPTKVAPEKLIADPIIEKAIRGALSTFSSKFTGELTKADLEKVTYLSFSGKKLTEVPKGLEKLTQLKALFLNFNQLTDVKGLEKLTQLTELHLRDNKLTELPKGLEKLTQLTELHLHNNPDLTKAQIAELQKALPKCQIDSNPKK